MTYECTVCGCVVEDQSVHSDFHKRLGHAIEVTYYDRYKDYGDSGDGAR